MVATDRTPRFGAALEIKTTDDGWGLEGLASDYGEDLQGDIIRPGAFADSLRRQPRPPLLFAHDHGRILGVPRELRETPAGLWGRWKISKTTLGAEVRQLLLDGAVDGLSIGFVPTQTRPGAKGLRELHGVDLLEVSIVAVPANPRARVSAVKTRPWADEAAGLHVKMDLVRHRLRAAGILDEDFAVLGPGAAGSADPDGRLGVRLRLLKARLRLRLRQQGVLV